MLKKHGTLLFVIVSAIAAANDDAPSGNKAAIHIGVETINYCPILCFEQNTTTGLLIELLDIIKEKSGINYQLTPYAIPRLRREFNSGNNAF